MNAKWLVMLAGGALVCTSVALSDEDDDPPEHAEPVRCLSMASIRSTKVIDDSTILFFHGRGRVYVNRLERECVGLARYGRFTYEVHTGARHARLCATDSITVLERTNRGFNCGLSMFEQISQAEAETFVAGPNRAVTSAEVELPPAPTQPPKEPPPETQ